jgi:hypothetical protein
MKVGIFPDMPMADYLALEAVSSGMIDTINNQCPAAAWQQSWLNSDRQRENSDEMDIGTIAHAMLLEGGSGAVEVIDPAMYPTKTTGNIPDGWTNKDIREARDRARAAGRIPILLPKFASIEAMVKAAMEFIPRSEVKDTFAAGDSEFTLVWQDGDVLCKARCDKLSADRGTVINYKTTGGSVEPDKWGRIQLLDYYVAGAFYVRGVQACFGVPAAHVFLCQETTAPYLCSLVGLSPQWLGVGDAKVTKALRTWAACMATGKFPGYPTRIAYPEMPQWEEVRFMEKQIADGIDYGSQG